MSEFTIFIIFISILCLLIYAKLSDTPLTKDDIDIHNIDLKRCEYVTSNEFFGLNNPEYLCTIDVYLIYLHNGKLYKRLD